MTPDTSGQHRVDYTRMASDLAGMAHVVVAADVHATYHVGDMIPKRLNCFDGGIRLYWPGFRRHSDPLQHPLLLRWQVEELGTLPARHFIGLIARTAAFSHPERYASWSDLESMRLKEAIAKARSEGDVEQMLALFEEDNRRQAQALKESEQEISKLTARLAEEQSRTEQLGLALRYRKEPLAAGEIEPVEVVTSVADAVRLAEQSFPGKLSFHLNGNSDEKTPFARPDEVMTALSWLATTWHDAKSGKVPCPRLDLEFKEVLSAWDFRSNQPEILAKSKKFKEWYRTKLPDGRVITLEPHLAYGVSKDPRECIRIAFNWDDQTETVVVGYIGQHQKNENT